MEDQISRRGLLKAGGAAFVGTSAGCISSGGSDSKTIEPEEMGEWMEKYSDLTYAEFAENSAQMHTEEYNRDMQTSGTHIDSAPERDPVDNPIIDEESVELTFTEVDSDAPAERYQAELRLQTNSESVFSDFENFEEHEDLYNERIAQLFGTVMMPTVATLFTDSHGPDYRASQTDPDSKAVEGINYILEDSAGNEETLQYHSTGADELSQIYNEADTGGAIKGTFYEKALEELE
jgi:hypothetical protein